MIERPFDLLNSLRGKECIITLKDGDIVEGILEAFDLSTNLVICCKSENSNTKKRKSVFIKGDLVVFVEASDGRSD
jgi:small nuclear ribonucleoprotein (snRNP)-like protein